MPGPRASTPAHCHRSAGSLAVALLEEGATTEQTEPGCVLAQAVGQERLATLSVWEVQATLVLAMVLASLMGCAYAMHLYSLGSGLGPLVHPASLLGAERTVT
eukprot:TRINITY_DN82729_c0_g1_i1.p2 TRINITY_DN82729_c0_g1~~TRINITY_DN82729_c0_g1_i1.p2  ORF type:complete len:103 (-),score=7.24 TRINITY_DN82729_c0_g1_i1:195-503(-)